MKVLGDGGRGRGRAGRTLGVSGAGVPSVSCGADMLGEWWCERGEAALLPCRRRHLRATDGFGTAAWSAAERADVFYSV